MLLRLQNAVAAMASMVSEQDRTANNLANANTVGFKRDRSFSQTLNERLDAEGAPRTDRIAAQWADMRTGAFEETGNPLDVAILGDGFFVISDDESGAQRYTRAGRFMPDADGLLRDPVGNLVEGEAGPIQINPEAADVLIGRDGQVMSGGQLVGKLRIVTFADPFALRRVGGASFEAGEIEPDDVENPTVRQGFVEASNVDAVAEMTDMIKHFRLFESQQRVLRTNDDVLGQITKDLGGF